MKLFSHPILKTLGPGILFASTAIGVSHLVQSTRAGGLFGYQLIGIILLANVLKYPFFEYGSRFANVTGKSIIDGYRSMGKWMLWTYFLITILTMFFVVAAVGKVTSGFFTNLLDIPIFNHYPLFADGLLLGICALILFIGQYNILDKLIKIIGIVLIISTLTAFLIKLFQSPAERIEGFVEPNAYTKEGVVFIIALMGWMPTAVDLSAWNSLWTIERIKQTKYHPTLKQTLFDFNFGYIVSTVLALIFVFFGARLIYGTNITMALEGSLFAGQIVNLYTDAIGQWSFIIIAAAAFSIMFGTALAVLDGYSRSLSKTVELMFKEDDQPEEMSRGQYRNLILLTTVGAFIIMSSYEGDKEGFKKLVDWATTLSFLVAPFIAAANFYLVMKKMKDKKPPIWLQCISWIGIVYLTGFSLYYLVFL